MTSGRVIVFILLATVASGAAMQPGHAQTQTGNRANGRDYQPTPGEVLPREHAAGVAPAGRQQQRSDRKLEQIDRTLLRNEGKSAASVPPIAGH